MGCFKVSSVLGARFATDVPLLEFALDGIVPFGSSVLARVGRWGAANDQDPADGASFSAALVMSAFSKASPSTDA